MQPDEVEDVHDEDAELEEVAKLEAELGGEAVARSMDVWACSMVDMTMGEALMEAVTPVPDALLVDKPVADHGPDVLSFPEQLEEPDGLEEEPDAAAAVPADEQGIIRELTDALGEPDTGADETLQSPRSDADSLPWVLQGNRLEDSCLDDSLEEDLQRDSGEPGAMHWSRDELEDAESNDHMGSLLHERSLFDDEDDISYPRRLSGSEGRPQTRGLRNAMLSQPAVAPSFTAPSQGDQQSRSNAGSKSRSGRQVVYVDHHHVHHHHHFHDPRDWNGIPGDLPPDPIQRREERNVEAEVESRKAGSSALGSAQGKHASKHSGGNSAGASRLPPTGKPTSKNKQNNGRVRSRRAGRHKGGRAPIDMGAAKNISVPSGSNTPEVSMLSTFSTTANSCMASSFRETASSADDSWTSDVSKPRSLTFQSAKKSNSDMPLQEYFRLMSRLPMDCRLKLSPYGVSVMER